MSKASLANSLPLHLAGLTRDVVWMRLGLLPSSRDVPGGWRCPTIAEDIPAVGGGLPGICASVCPHPSRAEGFAPARAAGHPSVAFASVGWFAEGTLHLPSLRGVRPPAEAEGRTVARGSSPGVPALGAIP